MLILDATAGPRGIWLNKEYENAIYMDVDLRDYNYYSKHPQIRADSKYLPFRAGIFDLIIFDPPHRSFSKKCNLGKEYGSFSLEDIKLLIKFGSAEFFRTLKEDGFLIFKWNTVDIDIEGILKLMSFWFDPLFGHSIIKRSGKTTTFWVCMVKTKISKITQKPILLA